MSALAVLRQKPRRPITAIGTRISNFGTSNGSLLAMILGILFVSDCPATDVRVLTDYWENTSAARAGFDEFVRSESRDSSPTTRYAEVLVLAKQRRNKDAIEASAIALRESPDQARLRQLRIWLLLLDGQQKLAIAEMSDFARHWASVRDQDGVVPLELANWLGRAFGVVDGPRHARSDPKAVEQAWARLMEVMNDEERQSLESGRADVLREFRDRIVEFEAVQQDESSARDQQRQEESMRLAEQLDRVEQQLADVTTQARDVSKHYAEGRRAVQEVTPGLIGAAVESDRRESWASWQVIALQNEIQRLNDRIAHETDPDRRRRLRAQRDALIAQLQWEGLALDQATADRVSSQYALQQARNELAANQMAESQENAQLERRRQQLLKSQTTTQRRQERLNKPDVRASGRIRSLRRSLDAVTTYLTFPLEVERARLLRN